MTAATLRTLRGLGRGALSCAAKTKGAPPKRGPLSLKNPRWSGGQPFGLCTLWLTACPLELALAVSCDCAAGWVANRLMLSSMPRVMLTASAALVAC